MLVDFYIAEYAHLADGLDIAAIREDAIAHLDGKKTLRKISGKRPGKKCGNSYVSADKNCKGHSSKTESGKRKLTAAGKKSAEELAAKVRARKGMKALGKTEPSKPAPQKSKKKKTAAEKDAFVDMGYVAGAVGMGAPTDAKKGGVRKRESATERARKKQAERETAAVNALENYATQKAAEGASPKSIFKKLLRDNDIDAIKSIANDVYTASKGEVRQTFREGKGRQNFEKAFVKAVSARYGIAPSIATERLAKERNRSLARNTKPAK